MNLMGVLVPGRWTNAVISHIFQVKDKTVNSDSPLKYILSTNPVAERWKMKLVLVWTAAVAQTSPALPHPFTHLQRRNTFIWALKHNPHVEGNFENSASHSAWGATRFLLDLKRSLPVFISGPAALCSLSYYSCMPICYLCADLYILM